MLIWNWDGTRLWSGSNDIQYVFLVNSGTNCAWVIFQKRRWVVRTARIGNFLCNQPHNCTNSRVLLLQSLPWVFMSPGSYSYGFQMLSPAGFWVKSKVSLILTAFSSNSDLCTGLQELLFLATTFLKHVACLHSNGLIITTSQHGNAAHIHSLQ